MADQPLRALTLWPEWAWAITHLDKRVENRTWWHGLPAGTRIAIHAGKHVGGRPGPRAAGEAMDLVCGMAWEAGWDSDWNAVGSTVRTNFEKGDRSVTCWSHKIPTSAIVAVVELGARGARPHNGWTVPGDEHWWLDEVVVLRQPVPCSGAQGLWTVPEEVAAAVLAQVPRPTPFDAMPGGGVCRCLNDASPVLCDDCPRGESGRPL